jgi:hypothetical protein
MGAGAGWIESETALTVVAAALVRAVRWIVVRVLGAVELGRRVRRCRYERDQRG